MKKFLKKLAYTLTLTSFFIYGFYTLFEQQSELNNIKEEQEKYIALLEEAAMHYEQLIETKENINSDSYIEEVAREKLDLVMPY